MTWLFDLLYAAALLLGWPWLIYRRWKRGPSEADLGELFGRVPRRPVSASCVWIHGVSLGEINATRMLVAELRTRAPSTVVVISSTTETGLAQARRLYPRHVVFRFPLDFSFAIRCALRRLRPSLIVLMELEVWPNLLELASRANIPVVIANGRLTAEKSLRSFSRPVLRSFARRMFRKLTWVCAQDATYAERFVRLGTPSERVEVTGSLKYDAAELGERVEGQEALAAEMGIQTGNPLWVCGSTGPDEEVICLAAYERLLERYPRLQLALVPRKPERFDEVATLIIQRGFACLRRSSGAPLLPTTGDATRPVFLGDTLGELRKFYGLATVVFVGRTLIPLGGSDLMEVAGLGRAMLFGPSVFNFTEVAELLIREGGAIRLETPLLGTAPAAAAQATETLTQQVAALLDAPERRSELGKAARRIIASQRGATRATVDRLLTFLGE